MGCIGVVIFLCSRNHPVCGSLLQCAALSSHWLSLSSISEQTTTKSLLELFFGEQFDVCEDNSCP